MDDLISRQAAIDAAYIAADQGHFAAPDTRYELIESAINDLPSARQWRPVSEAPDDQEVLVTVKRRPYGFNPYIETYIAKYDAKQMLWISRAGNFELDVLAWMPMPKPYKEEQE